MEDLYTSLVLICGVSEDLFWHADLSFLLSVAENKAAYGRWLYCERQYLMERERR